MKRSTIGRVAMVFGLAVVIGLAGVSCGGPGSDPQDLAQMADGADQFLMSLSDEQRARDVRLRIGRTSEVSLRPA